MGLSRWLSGSILAAALLPVAAAEARGNVAERFDARITVGRDGTLHVVETIVVRFDGDRSRTLTRDLPTRRNDGIDIVSASIDGVRCPFGRAPGQVELGRSSRTRAKWHFEPAAHTTRTFELEYRVRGAVRVGGAADIVEWQPLPREHDYAIAASTIDIALPEQPLSLATVERRRVSRWQSGLIPEGVQVIGHEIRPNGWMAVTVLLPRGSAATNMPRWQFAQESASRLAPAWIAAAAALLFVGMVALFSIRQHYDAPTERHADAAEPVDPMHPALAGALVNNGRAKLEHAMAALLSLAEQREVAIVERDRASGHRRFTVTRTPRRRPLPPSDDVLLTAIFTGRHGVEEAVALETVRKRIVRRFARFNTAVVGELIAAGLVDEDRRAIRSRFAATGVAALALAAIVAVALAVLTGDAGPWPFLLPLALVATAVVAFVCAALHTPLSNEGLRQSAEWRTFKHVLERRLRKRSRSDGSAPQPLTLAVAFGQAGAWAKHLESRGGEIPPWFQACGAEGAQALSAFVAQGGAGMGHPAA